MAACDEGTVILFDTQDDSRVILRRQSDFRVILRRQPASIWGIAILSDSRFATSDRSGVVVLWDASSATVIWEVKLPGTVRSLVSVDGDFVFAGVDGYGALVLDARDGSIVKLLHNASFVVGGVAILRPGSIPSANSYACDICRAHLHASSFFCAPAAASALSINSLSRNVGLCLKVPRVVTPRRIVMMCFE